MLHRVDEIRNVDYLPNNDDILHSRRRTSDIQKLEFQINFPAKSGVPEHQQMFCMFDVGGQRGERRKWIQVFDGVSAVMFLIDSSSFDSLDEENGRNKLREALKLFSEVWTTRFLLSSDFVLLFNKQDILREKIERGIKLADYFPEFADYNQKQNDKALLSKAGEKLNLFRSSKRASNSRFLSLTSDLSSGNNNLPNKGRKSARTSIASSFVGNKAKSKSLYDSFMNPRNCNDEVGDNNYCKLESFNNKQSQSFESYHMQQRQTLDSVRRVNCENANSQQSRQSTSPRQKIKQMSNNTKQQQTDTTTTKNTQTTTVDQDSSKIFDKPFASPTHDNQQHQSTLKNNYSSSNNHNKANNEEAYLRARSFIKDKFLEITRQSDTNSRKYSIPNLNNMYNSKYNIDQPKRTVCYHYTTATDTNNIRDLFSNLQKMIAKSMKEQRRQ